MMTRWSNNHVLSKSIVYYRSLPWMRSPAIRMLATKRQHGHLNFPKRPYIAKSEYHGGQKKHVGVYPRRHGLGA
jgi:hypothetical protein